MTRTLADMTPTERQECVGRWAEVRRRLVIIAEIYERDGDATVFRPETRRIDWYLLQDLTPRLDLPRAWTPTGDPVPGEWEEKIYQDGIGDYIRFTRQRRYITDWEVPHESR